MEQTVKQFRKRNAILSCLRCTHVHPSAEDLHRMLQAEHPDISLATVYRNLSLFKRQGLIRSLGAVDGIERFDADTSPHVHFICTGCGRVLDLPQLTPPQALEAEAQASSGCQITGCQLTYTGVCLSCQQQNQEELS